jgi:hypothetical protein
MELSGANLLQTATNSEMEAASSSGDIYSGAALGEDVMVQVC